jgi:hypothetical protein
MTYTHLPVTTWNQDPALDDLARLEVAAGDLSATAGTSTSTVCRRWTDHGTCLRTAGSGQRPGRSSPR